MRSAHTRTPQDDYPQRQDTIWDKVGTCIVLFLESERSTRSAGWVWVHILSDVQRNHQQAHHRKLSSGTTLQHTTDRPTTWRFVNNPACLPSGSPVFMTHEMEPNAHSAQARAQTPSLRWANVFFTFICAGVANRDWHRDAWLIWAGWWWCFMVVRRVIRTCRPRRIPYGTRRSVSGSCAKLHFIGPAATPASKWWLSW